MFTHVLLCSVICFNFKNIDIVKHFLPCYKMAKTLYSIQLFSSTDKIENKMNRWFILKKIIMYKSEID